MNRVVGIGISPCRSIPVLRPGGGEKPLRRFEVHSRTCGRSPAANRHVPALARVRLQPQQSPVLTPLPSFRRPSSRVAPSGPRRPGASRGTDNDSGGPRHTTVTEVHLGRPTVPYQFALFIIFDGVLVRDQSQAVPVDGFRKRPPEIPTSRTLPGWAPIGASTSFSQSIPRSRCPRAKRTAPSWSTIRSARYSCCRTRWGRRTTRFFRRVEMPQFCPRPLLIRVRSNGRPAT